MEDKVTDDDLLIEHYAQVEGSTPLDIMVEKEKRRTMLGMLRHLLPHLGPKDRKVFWLFVIKGMTMDAIGWRTGMTRPGVFQRLERIPSKLAQFITEEQKEEWRGHLLPPQSDKEAGPPTSCGYPFEYLQHVNTTPLDKEEREKKCWRKSDGIMTYYSQWCCKLPEYFDECFEQGHKTVCPICEKCTRRNM